MGRYTSAFWVVSRWSLGLLDRGVILRLLSSFRIAESPKQNMLTNNIIRKINGKQ